MQVPIDAYQLISLVVIAAVTSLLSFGLIIGKMRSPTFRLRIGRQNWVYAIMANKIGELKEVIIPMNHIENTSYAFSVGKGTYFWRTKDKLGRPTVFPYKKKMAAIYSRGMPFPEAFADESLASLGGYTAEEFTNILESEVEKNIVEAMRPKTIPFAVILGLLIIVIIAIVYMGITINGLQTTINHLTTSPPPTNSTVIH